MTKELQELTNKIHTLVPETMELRFGCRVRQSKTGAEGFLVGTPENENGFGYWFNSENTIYPILEEHITILGHDITLETVLRALELVDSDTVMHYGISSSGEIMRDYYSKVGGRMWAYVVPERPTWHLGKPLHLQLEETITWLNNSIIQVV